MGVDDGGIDPPTEERTLEQISRELDDARARGVRWPFPPSDEAERWARERLPDVSFWDEHDGKDSPYDIAVEAFRAGFAFARGDVTAGKYRRRAKHDA